MNYVLPNKEWYENISNEKSVAPRCPHANVNKCPRYYQSLYLFGEMGMITKIAKEKVEKLDKTWGESDLLPVVAEYGAGISSSGGTVHSFTNHCPEVIFKVFNLFASSLHKYADEIDRDHAHQKLERLSQPNDWRWNWSAITEIHYSDCPAFHQLSTQIIPTSPNESESKNEVFLLSPRVFGVGINLKSLYRKFKSWKNRI